MSRKRLQQILALIIILALLGGGYYLYKRTRNTYVKDSGEGLSDYSAIVMSNGSIYFGKIASVNQNTVDVDDVFSYAVVNSDGTPATSAAEGQRPTIFDASKVGVALASNYHFMREQVVLYYTLKNESEVVTQILKYKADPNAVAATPTPTTSPTATPKK